MVACSLGGHEASSVAIGVFLPWLGGCLPVAPRRVIGILVKDGERAMARTSAPLFGMSVGLFAMLMTHGCARPWIGLIPFPGLPGSLPQKRPSWPPTVTPLGLVFESPLSSTHPQERIMSALLSVTL